MEEYDNVEFLANGAFGRVYKATRRQDQSIVVVKQIPLINCDDSVHNEIRLLRGVQHPNVVRYLDSFVDGESKMFCIVMEFADAGDLHTLIRSRKEKSQPFRESELWNFFSAIARGLLCLHQNRILHRDLVFFGLRIFLIQGLETREHSIDE